MKRTLPPYRNIRSHHAAIAVLALLLSGCDTTEDGYYVGSLDDVYLTADPATQLRVPADGQPRDINVLSNVEWEIEAPEGTFAASASGHKGNGTITVTAGLNVNDQVRSATLRIYAREFDKSISIDLIQAKMSFSMETQEFAEAPEQGAVNKLLFNSSIDWRFNISDGESGWLDFDPGLSGGGDWNEIEVSASWKPNYTTSPRSVTLQLYPSDESLLEYITLPPRFTMTQAAGTLPADIALTASGAPTYYTIPLSITYKSNAPIDELGVIIAGSGQRFVAPLQQGAVYPQNGSYNFTLDGLEQNTHYTLTPFVKSKVGEVSGSQLQIITDGDIVFTGPQMTESVINPAITSVDASFSISSDITIKTITAVLKGSDGQSIAEQHETVDANNGRLVWTHNTTLTPDTDYSFAVSVNAVDPNNNETKNFDLGSFPFKTNPKRTPQEGDNKPIN